MLASATLRLATLRVSFLSYFCRTKISSDCVFTIPCFLSFTF